MTNQEKNFLQLVAGPGLYGQEHTGIPACVTMAQAILESGWGRSGLFRQANNPFGIKYAHIDSRLRGGDDAPKYGEYTAPTRELIDGRPQVVEATFAKYFTLSNAFYEHALLISELPRYRPAFDARNDWRMFTEKLMECGYSTDRPPLCKVPGCKHYAGRLIQIIEEFNLDDPKALELYAKGPAPAASGAAAQEEA